MRGTVGRIVNLSAVAALLLTVVAVPVSADDPAFGYIRGYVRSQTGNPALGVCVSTGEYATDVQADGSYELQMSYVAEVQVYFYDCHEAPNYPYVPVWFWGGDDTWRSGERISVRPGTVAYASVTLPSAPGSPPEFGAVTGVISRDGVDEFLYLVNENGDVYTGFTDLIGHMAGREDGRYIVSAPPGDYRLYTHNRQRRDQYLPVFFGSHPRGYASAFDEGHVFRIESGRAITDVDFDLLPGSSANAGSRPDQYDPYVPMEVNQPGLLLYASEPHIFDRIAVYRATSRGEGVGDFHLLAFPGAQGASPSVVEVRVPIGLLGAFDFETIPIWLNNHELEACTSDGEDRCVASRLTDQDREFGDIAVLVVRTSAGGILRLGPRPQFYDSENSTFAGDILWLAIGGITMGCNPPANDLFCPNAAVTRGQMAAFLVRGLGLSESLDDPFIDDDGSIFEPSIEKLAAAGITMGCNPAEGNTKFCPHDYVTRGQMAAFLVRALGYSNAGDGDLFLDDDGSIFEDAIDKLATAGVTKGCNPAEGNTKFCPHSYVTRGQMAAFLHRALG